MKACLSSLSSSLKGTLVPLGVVEPDRKPQWKDKLPPRLTSNTCGALHGDAPSPSSHPIGFFRLARCTAEAQYHHLIVRDSDLNGSRIAKVFVSEYLVIMLL